MYIEQLYTGCLSEAAYYIESEGEAAVIDPLRDTSPYLELATRRNASIKYIFETHFHADFVSGHIDLSQSTGAPIIYGPNAKASFDIQVATDNQVFTLGKLQIQVLHTPGHTPESACFLLKEETGKDHAIFTGDTLFVGDVGRPDLAQNGEDLTTETLAGMLYDSLQQKIVPLADDVIVYPAHGPGSSCGKNLGPDTYSTIGDEKQGNYALQANTRDEFIKAVTEGLTPPPQYFAINARINKEGYEKLEQMLEQALTPLSVEDFASKATNDNTIILDTRPGAEFTESFIPDSIFIGLEGRFAEWAGNLLPFDKPLLLVTPIGKERETVIRLARVGFSLFEGYLNGGMDAWKKAGKPLDMVINVEADELAMDLPFDDRLIVLDVRKEAEFADGHVKDAVNTPLSNLTDPGSMSPIQDEDNLYINCASGYRSVIAASLLKRQGIHNLRNVLGGWKAIKEEPKIPTEKNKAALN